MDKKHRKRNFFQEFFGLTEDEEKHIKEDGYDVWNFDEEELEDDDYYAEDDE